MSSTNLLESFEKIRTDLRTFIDLSIQENEQSWEQWLNSLPQGTGPRCWERKNCRETECVAYKNDFGRCWLVAGTMCGGEPAGKFAKKYSSCRECDIYQETVYQNAQSEIEEHLVVLVHSLRTRQKELKELATTDFLTGLYNRRYFDIIIDREIERVKRENYQLIFMMIDINDFKKINDTYGHLEGDNILKECAQILQSSTRSSDLIVRYGGDEFLAILHDSSTEYAEAIMSRINNRLDEANSHREKDHLPLSLSIGLSIYHGETTIDEALRQADAKMYENKQLWKNTRRDADSTP